MYPNSATALAETVLDELVRRDVRCVVVAPGSRSAPLAIAAARRRDVDLFVEIDERSAGFFALGRAKLSGRPSAVVVTSGTAVANLAPATVEADMSGTPLLLLTADRPPELHAVGANQTIEQAGFFGDGVRWAATLAPDEDGPGTIAFWRTTVARAVSESRGWSGRAGPVQLNLAFREPLTPHTDDGRTRGRTFEGDADRRTPVVAHPAPSRSVGLNPEWSRLERGLVLAGTADRPIAGYADRLAAALGWPLVVEPGAGGRPPQTISTMHHLAQSEMVCESLRPEVILTVGRVGLSRPVTSMVADVPLVATMGWNDPGRAAAEVYAGPVHVPAGEPDASRDGDWRRRWLALEGLGREALNRALDELEPMTEARAARDVGRAAGDQGMLIVGSSTPIRDVDRYLEPGSFRIVSNRGASGIDGFVSTALGVAAEMATTGDDRVPPAIGLAGDLSLLHDGNGFLVRPRPRTVLVVLDNDGGGIFSFLPQAGETDVFERVFGTPTGCDIEALCRTHGVEYRAVTEPRLLVDEIRNAAEDRTGDETGSVIRVEVDRTTQVEIARHLTASVVTAVQGR